MKILVVVALIGALSYGTSQPASRAHSSLAGEDLRMPKSVAEAEAEGKNFPPTGQPAYQPSTEGYPGVTGTANRVCVTAQEPSAPAPGGRPAAFGPPVLTGQFVIGAGLSGALRLRANVVGKVWWKPLHGVPIPLLVRGVNLDVPSDTVRFAYHDTARNSGGEFFPTGVLLPSGGRWMLVATAGNNWGCVLMTAGR